MSGALQQNPLPRPRALQGDLRNLPKALRPLVEEPRWVCWKYERRLDKRGQSKWAKMPYQPQNPRERARTNDPTTWGTYAEALAAFEAGKFEGIGFNLDGSMIAAFDFDKCRDPITGAIAPEVTEIVNRANSYTEVTVSGTGLRVIGYGKDHTVHRKQRLPHSDVGVESYSGAKRYIVVTGKPLADSPPRMADISSEMKRLVTRLDREPGKNTVRKFKRHQLRAKPGPSEEPPNGLILPRELVDLINNGVPPDDDLSNAFHHAVCWLHDCGWSAQRIEAFIADKPIVPERYYDRRDGLAGEIARCLQNAKQQSAPNGWKGEGPVDPVDLWGKFEPPTLPRGLLPKIMEDFALDRGRAMNADMSGIAASCLAVCAAAIPDGIKLQPKKFDEEWLESARLRVVLVGPPSTMKTPIMSAAVKPLREINARLAKAYAEDRARYDRLPKKEKAKAKPPNQTRLMIQDATMEAAQEVLKDSPNGIFCYQDELTGFFGGIDKYAGPRGAARDRAFWLEANEGGPYWVDRVNRGSVYIPNLSISMLGGIQPEPMRKISEDSVDDGLLQRFVPIMLRPAVAPGRDERPSGAVDEYRSLIRKLHNLRPPIGVRPRGQINLRFDDGALAIRKELEKKHLSFEQCEAINRKLTAHIGKYNGIFARLCVVFHCAEHAGAGLPAVVTEATARRVAGFLHEFLLPHAFAFYTGVLGLSNDHDRLAAVAGYILAHKLEKITNRDVQRGDRTMRRLDRRDIDSVFDQLEAFGWVFRVPGSRPIAPMHCVVNPAVHTRFARRAEAEAKRRAAEKETIKSMLGGKKNVRSTL
jgi:hypothetical protein